jgi:glycerate kinase
VAEPSGGALAAEPCPNAVRLRVLMAPDSFKGCLTSVEVSQALAAGWGWVRPDDRVELAPLADGGEGTMEALLAGGQGWAAIPVSSVDALGRPIAGRFLRADDRAVVELADASGLSRVNAGERDALRASTYGTGLTLAAAVGLGVRRIVLGVGGSATTDGGAGLLCALGARLFDDDGRELAPGGAALARLARIDLSGISPVLGEVHLVIASDVTNPLLGTAGAAAVYGPQKGASKADVELLDRALGRLADVLEGTTGVRVRDVPGSGAAGGTVAGLLAVAGRFASLEVRPGIDTVMELTGFEERLTEADVVLTGEGRIDEQTAYGKTALGVARRAAEAGVPCVAVGGSVTLEGRAALEPLGVVTVPVSEGPGTLEEAMAAGTGPVERAGALVARLVSLGERLARRG